MQTYVGGGAVMGINPPAGDRSGGAASGGCAASGGSAAAAGNAAGRRRLAGRAKPVPAFSGLKFTAVPEVHWSERDPALEQLPLSRGPKKVIGSAKMHLDVV